MEESKGKSQEQEAASLLGGLLDAVYAGDLTADGPAGAALVRHLEGALFALQVLDEQRLDRGVDPRG